MFLREGLVKSDLYGALIFYRIDGINVEKIWWLEN
jgi:hypothetical protein